MIYKVAELRGQLLDAAVASVCGFTWEWDDGGLNVLVAPKRDEWDEMRYSTDWFDGGPLIQEHRIAIDLDPDRPKGWTALVRDDEAPGEHDAADWIAGDTALEAAMRALVRSKAGENIELPEPTGPHWSRKGNP